MLGVFFTHSQSVRAKKKSLRFRRKRALGTLRKKAGYSTRRVLNVRHFPFSHSFSIIFPDCPSRAMRGGKNGFPTGSAQLAAIPALPPSVWKAASAAHPSSPKYLVDPRSFIAKEKTSSLLLSRRYRITFSVCYQRVR